MPTTYEPPKATLLTEILPSEPLLLMGAGPVPIPHAVAQANGVVINHLGDSMNKVIASLKEMAKYSFQTNSDKILGVAGPSSAAMEMGITNLVWPGRKVLCLQSGTFSKRFGIMAERVGGTVRYLEGPEPSLFQLSEVEDILAHERFDVLTIAQGETSCGVYNKNLPEIVQIAKRHGCLVIVDAVCTLTTMPMKMDEWQIDVLITGGQKGLSSIPGVSLIAFSKEAWSVIENRTAPMPHWCFDAREGYKFWGHQQYHYTAPVPGILALHEALRLICEETLEQRFIRHKRCSLALQEGIEAMGLTLFAPVEMRLNSVVAINLPPSVDSYKLRSFMTEKYKVEISGAFGHNVVRIGQMGDQCRSHHLFRTLHALGMAFKHLNYEVNLTNGMAAMEDALSKDNESFSFY